MRGPRAGGGGGERALAEPRARNLQHGLRRGLALVESTLLDVRGDGGGAQDFFYKSFKTFLFKKTGV